MLAFSLLAVEWLFFLGRATCSGAEWPVVVHDPVAWVAREGDATANLSVSISIQPTETWSSVQWTWQQKTQRPEVSSTGFLTEGPRRVYTDILQVANVGLEAAGNWTCHVYVTDLHGTFTEHVTHGVLHVRGRPASPTLQGVDTALCCSDVILTCSNVTSTSLPPNATLPDFRYQWVKDGEPLLGHNTSKLHLQKVAAPDSGNYSCQAREELPQGMWSALSSEHRLQVAGLPIYPVIVGTQTVVQGGDVILTCRDANVTSETCNLTDAVYVWRKDSKVIRRSKVNTLILSDITPAESGDYTCLLADDAINMTSCPSPGHGLLVLVPPRLRLSAGIASGHIRAVEDSYLTLTCLVLQATPQVPRQAYSWSFLPWGESREVSLPVHLSSLTIGPLKSSNKGRYSCQARNDMNLTMSLTPGEDSIQVDVGIASEGLGAFTLSEEFLWFSMIVGAVLVGLLIGLVVVCLVRAHLRRKQRRLTLTSRDMEHLYDSLQWLASEEVYSLQSKDSDLYPSSLTTSVSVYSASLSSGGSYESIATPPHSGRRSYRPCVLL